MENEDSGFLPCKEESIRYGGPMTANDDEEEEEDDEDVKLIKIFSVYFKLLFLFQKRRNAERERKKAEVRKRLEEAGRMKKAKKGFLTPERKKKLRKLLMLKAAEDLKQQQVLREQQRAKALQERILPIPNDLENMDEGKFLIIRLIGNQMSYSS